MCVRMCVCVCVCACVWLFNIAIYVAYVEQLASSIYNYDLYIKFYIIVLGCHSWEHFSCSYVANTWRTCSCNIFSIISYTLTVRSYTITYIDGLI